MAAKTKAREHKGATGRYYIFGTYGLKEDALHAASVLRKNGYNARARQNARTRKWYTLYASRKRRDS